MKDFKNWGLRIHKDLERNYYALWMNLKTTRLDLGDEIKLPYESSEFYDVGITSRCNSRCNFCLTEDSLVCIKGGNKIKIKDIKVGDFVKSYNGSIIEYKKVLGVSEREYSGDLIEIEDTDGNILRLTPNHKVFTQRGYIRADELLDTDLILKDE